MAMSKKAAKKESKTAAATKTIKKVLVNFIQDRSGSMQSTWDETLNGFKKFVEDLRDNAEKDGIEYLFSLTTFDTLIETPLVAVPIKNVDVDILKQHGPRGGTALYDATGATITNTEADSHGAEKIIVVVVTDGQENSSREWTKDRLQTSIESKLKLGNWTFTYLGTQPETWNDAGAIGVAAGAVASYTPAMASAAYAATSHAVRSMSNSSAMGTRSLMSTYVPQHMARAAGMNIRPNGPMPTMARTRPAPKPTPKSVTGSNRWR
jgi:hypothetical protein